MKDGLSVFSISPVDDTHYLDAKGARCPEPLMLIRQALRSLKPGDRLVVLCDDPAAHRDIPRYCTFIGHRLLETHRPPSEPDSTLCYFSIQKKS